MMCSKLQKQPPNVFYKKIVKNFAIFKGMHLRWSLFLKNVCEWQLLKLIKQQNVVIDTILVSLWATVNLFSILILLVALQEY